MELTQEQKEYQLLMDFQQTFGSEQGKRVLEKLSKFCLEKQSCYTSNNSHETAFNEGARSVILYIRRNIERKIETESELNALNEKENENSGTA